MALTLHKGDKLMLDNIWNNTNKLRVTGIPADICAVCLSTETKGQQTTEGCNKLEKL